MEEQQREIEGLRAEIERNKTNTLKQLSMDDKTKKIISMVPDMYEAWHAGKSSWGKYSLLNKYSIGIEINNPGHQYGYKNLSS